MSMVLDDMQLSAESLIPQQTDQAESGLGEFVTELGPSVRAILQHAGLGILFCASALVFAGWAAYEVYNFRDMIPWFSVAHLSWATLIPLSLLNLLLFSGGVVLISSARWLWRTHVSVHADGFIYHHEGRSSPVEWCHVDSIIETVHYEATLFPFLRRPVERNYLIVRCDGELFDFNPVLIEDLDSWVDIMREAAIRLQISWDVVEQH